MQRNGLRHHPDYPSHNRIHRHYHTFPSYSSPFKATYRFPMVVRYATPMPIGKNYLKSYLNPCRTITYDKKPSFHGTTLGVAKCYTLYDFAEQNATPLIFPHFRGGRVFSFSRRAAVFLRNRGRWSRNSNHLI